MAKPLGPQAQARAAFSAAAKAQQARGSATVIRGAKPTMKPYVNTVTGKNTRTLGPLSGLKKPKGGIVTPGLVKKKLRKSTAVASFAGAGAGAAAGAGGGLFGGGIGGTIAKELGKFAAGYVGRDIVERFTGGGGGQSLSSGAGGVTSMARDLLPVGTHDISPGIPAMDVQVVDPDNIVINNATGKPAKLVPVGAKIQRRRKVRRGGMSAAKVAQLIHESKQDSMMQTVMMVAMMGRH